MERRRQWCEMCPCTAVDSAGWDPNCSGGSRPHPSRTPLDHCYHLKPSLKRSPWRAPSISQAWACSLYFQKASSW